MYKGSCLCGKIHYQINGELSDFGYCHCKSCQKASGTAHASNAGVNTNEFMVEDAAGLLREYESSPGKFRAFCSNCGSPLYARVTARDGTLRIRLGTLDTPLNKKAKAHTFIKEMAAWHLIEGYQDIPVFEEWASKDVLVQVGSKQPE
ncbi:MAG: GFA family protein [Pseudomonadota bacterium]